MQILAIATAIAVVCALRPIPNQGARHCGDLFSVALARFAAQWGLVRGSHQESHCFGIPGLSGGRVEDVEHGTAGKPEYFTQKLKRGEKALARNAVIVFGPAPR